MGLFSNLFNDPFKPSNGKWLFVGDSQTNTMATNYVNQLKSMIGFTKFKIIQKNGAPTSWMLTELNKELAINPNYDYVVIWGGYNDMYGTQPPDQARVTAFNNLRAMVTKVKGGLGSLGKPRKAIVVNLHCDSLRGESVRNKTNEAQTAILYKDIFRTGANYVVPTRTLTGGCPQDTATLTTNRKTFCQKNDALCHLNPVGNKAIATNISQKIKWI
jgi:hypothetical protein